MRALSLSVTPLLLAYASASSPNLQRATQYGPVDGISVSTNVNAWLGVPFAAPPVGPLRWKPPQPPTPWSTVIQADTSPVCFGRALNSSTPSMQNPLFTNQGPFVGTEDCLYLDIWTPASASAGGKLPTLVYSFGGGFVSGQPNAVWDKGSDFLKAANAAGTAGGQGVVLVELNYRLGGLGFMGSSALAAEAGSFGSSGNYGILDQVAALRWVQINIASFGGDPGNVMFIGESAGAASVNVLLASPLAVGLFQKASAMASTLGLGQTLTQAAAQQSGAFCARTYCSASTSASATLACLRGLPAETAFSCTLSTVFSAALDAGNPLLSGAGFFRGIVMTDTVNPNIDNYVLYGPPTASIAMGVVGPGLPLPSVPLVLGCNTQASNFFTLQLYQSELWDISEEFLSAVVRTTIQSLAYRVDPSPLLEASPSQPLSKAALAVGSVANTRRLLDVYLDNLAEFQAQVPAAQEVTKSVCEEYLQSTNGSHSQPCTGEISVYNIIWSAILTDLTFTTTATWLCDAYAKRELPCYRYQFNQSADGHWVTSTGARTPNSNAAVKGKGAFHTLNLAFLWHTWGIFDLPPAYDTRPNAKPDPTRLTYVPSPQGAMLASQMMQYWLSFAAMPADSVTGNNRVLYIPGVPAGLPAWTQTLGQWPPSVGAGNRSSTGVLQQYMLLQQPGLGMSSGFRQAAVEAWRAFDIQAPQNPVNYTAQPAPHSGGFAGIEKYALSAGAVVGIIIAGIIVMVGLMVALQVKVVNRHGHGATQQATHTQLTRMGSRINRV